MDKKEEISGCCPVCSSKNIGASQFTSMTLVGYHSPPGHNHDDNCIKRHFHCLDCGKRWVESKRRTCPTCDWKGKEECFCHTGKKVDKWSDEV